MHTRPLLLLLLLLLLLQVADNGELQLVDATDAWVAHTPLYLAVVFSLVIAALCALLVLQGLALLRKVNADLQVMARDAWTELGREGGSCLAKTV